jgi:hypothetical protein
MIKIRENGEVILNGKVAEAFRVAFAGIYDEVKGRDPQGAIDDWECAMAEFIGENIESGRFEDKCERIPAYKWRDQKVRYTHRRKE